MREHGDENFNVPWEGTEGNCEHIKHHESSGQPGGCEHHGSHTPEPSTALGDPAAEEAKPSALSEPSGIGWGFVLSPFCPLPWAASLQSEQRDFSLQLLHFCGNLPCLEFRLWLFFSCLSLVTQTLQDFLFTEAVRWLWSAAPFFANQERSATENKSPQFPHGGSAFSQTSYPASDC